MDSTHRINVKSEIGKLETVILHRPGVEIERMTPENAEKALFSDILNQEIANKEYDEFEGVLKKVAKTLEVKDLLADILEDKKIRTEIIDNVFDSENLSFGKEYFNDFSNEKLAKSLIEGMQINEDYSDERYALKPLYNFFFTRDASISVYDKVLIGKMANQVRDREAMIMDNIFRNHNYFKAETMNPINETNSSITIEGGDVLIAREDILLIGVGGRTTKQGIDFIVNQFKNKNHTQHIILQELPLSPESFIHLDMVFTLLDNDKCMVYSPLILEKNNYETIHITIDGDNIKKQKEDNLLSALKKLGIDLKPVYCGGTTDNWTQQREQWHSGANFFAFAPGKVIGYSRNVHTIAEMNKNGFDVLKAKDIISGKLNPDDYKSCVITIDGAELPRGGGGARCMTMPVRREDNY